MADKRISNLPVGGALTGAELFAAVQDGVTKQTTLPTIEVLQGTKIVEVFRPFAEAGAGVSELQNVCNIVNAFTAFTVPANQMGLISFLQFAGGVFGTEFTKYMYMLKVGAGTYGSAATSITPANIIKLAPITIIPQPDFVYDVGDIGTTDIHTFVNGAGPYVVNGLTVFEGIQNGDDKIWLFVGGNGNYGTGATATVADDFVDLTAQDPIPSPITYFLPVKTIATTPYTLTDEDLNRPLHFTSNNQVLNITNDLATDPATLYSFIAYFSGTGTHVVNKNASPIFTGGQDDLVKGLCYDTSGTTLWTVQKWVKDGDIGVPTLQEVTDEGSTTTLNISVAGHSLGTGSSTHPTAVAFGKNAMGGATSFGGAFSTAIGDGAIEIVGISGGNTAIGHRALTRGGAGNNTAVGSLAFTALNNATNQRNVAIGSDAGRRTVGATDLTEASSSIFIGASTKGGGNGRTNQIVIGDDATGEGSNTATLGNTSIVKTFLRGALSLIARTKASVTGLTAGLFIFDSGDSNRPTIHNGTDWKGLAYRDEVVTSLETGTEISFANPQIYNSATTPATGNITNDLTGALQGVVQKIYHNHTTEPTVPAGWVLMGAGAYVESELNIIYAEFAGGTRVEYWIVNEA